MRHGWLAWLLLGVAAAVAREEVACRGLPEVLFFGEVPATWDDSNYGCVGVHGSLLIVTDQDVMDVAVDYLRLHLNSSITWIYSDERVIPKGRYVCPDCLALDPSKPEVLCHNCTQLLPFACVCREIPCRVGFFGENCSMECHCADGAECPRTDGFCESGCQKFWKGSSCSEKIKKVKNIILFVVGGACVAVFAAGIAYVAVHSVYRKRNSLKSDGRQSVHEGQGQDQRTKIIDELLKPK